MQQNCKYPALRNAGTHDWICKQCTVQYDWGCWNPCTSCIILNRSRMRSHTKDQMHEGCWMLDVRSLKTCQKLCIIFSTYFRWRVSMRPLKLAKIWLFTNVNESELKTLITCTKLKLISKHYFTFDFLVFFSSSKCALTDVLLVSWDLWALVWISECWTGFGLLAWV